MSKKSILEIFRSTNTVFSLKDFALILGDTDFDSLKSKINYYVRKGDLYQVRRGIYAKSRIYDYFELATKIFTPSYVSLETVLANEGVVTQYYSNVFSVSYLSRTIKCDGKDYTYRKIKSNILTNNVGLLKKNNYFIASKERAFLDIIYLSKNYHFDNLSSINWESCFDLAKIYNQKSLIKKLETYHKNA